MEVIRRRHTGKKRRVNHGKEVGGGLTLKVSDVEGILCGDVKIFLNFIHNTGSEGGCRSVSLRFVGPKETAISRFDIEGAGEYVKSEG